MNIGLYGGTFNPPHGGHLAAARAAAATLRLDRLIFIPAGTPPHKDLPAGSPTDVQRLEMTALLADQLLQPELVRVWDGEVRRPGKSYTVDTLRQMAQQWPGAQLWLLMGADMFATLQQWHQPEDVLSLAGVCAFGRSAGDALVLLQPQAERLRRDYGAQVVTMAIPSQELVDVSSTQLRALLARGEGADYLPQAVYGYILRKKLYGTQVELDRLTLEQLRCVSYSMVKAKRLAHIRGVEEEGARLAERWGADPEEMRRAGILHDCTKYLGRQEHLEICRRYGVALDQMEQGAGKLLHAKSGAALAKAVFGQSETVVRAILYHTTGRGNMTLEEKLLYLADYMEPTRDFPEVAQMRRLAYEDLDRAVLMGVELSIQEMRALGRQIHPNTLEAEQTLRKGLSL